jgi:hypothetical protein
MAAATTSDIRAWAQANGYDVGDRGRLPVEITDAFNKSNGKRVAATPAPAKKAPAARKATPATKATAPTKATPAKKAAPAKQATPANEVTPTRKPTAAALPDEAPAKGAVVTPAIIVKDDAAPLPTLEERVATLEQQVAFLKGKVDQLGASPAKRGFGRRR